MAQKWRVPRSTSNRNIPPLARESLERLALRYVERYATTRGKLTRYLERKLYQRGWEDEKEPEVAALVERFAELGYVNDRQFAEAMALALKRRGYGSRRIDAALYSAGIERGDVAAVGDLSREEAVETAMNFARRRRLGPFAEGADGPDARRRAFAAMARAGHPLDIIEEILTEGQ